MLDGAIVGAIGGAVGGLAMVAVLAIFARPQPCPDCGTPSPIFRRPTSRRQLLRGGWTCTNCGCEMDSRGRRVEDDDRPPPRRYEEFDE